MEKKYAGINKKKVKIWVWAYVFVAPTIILILLLNIWPIIQTSWYSFNELKGMAAPRWIGFDNYLKAFHDKELLKSLLNTFLYAVVAVPVGVALSLMTAVFLNVKIRGKGFFRTLYFIPVVSAPAAIAMVWRWLYNSEYGLINYTLSLFGIKGPNWLGSSHFILSAVIIVGIWSMVGYNMIILLAGLQDIPKTFYEAAEIDGAGSFCKFRNITLPLVSPTLFFVTLTTFISSFQVFDHIFMMVGQSNPAEKAAQSVVYMYYRYTFVNYNKGYGSTIATILLIIILIITFIQMKLQKKWVFYR
ncbi:carbohydrate ABC transporter permease [Anaerocolumna sp. MB42-C2]|uniref:carbohydrate ABC transporter permease n=1 Tax=Anaerocolumna sp. MB42-C2 TaxID=3070997 RepID=UPI0027DEDDAB|nr:sugar ABC transporter permease [Anaerocolumna sp. MB42-C2]WMJ89741.1 sugar ABC transporter permease [Anaerocolumna sp. MB42-C2]